MTARFLISTAALIGMALSASCGQPAYAQEDQSALLCMPIGEYRQALADQYNERPVSSGIVNDQVYTQLFTSPEGTWTILAVGTDQGACLLATGNQWDQGPADLRGALQ